MYKQIIIILLLVFQLPLVAKNITRKEFLLEALYGDTSTAIAKTLWLNKDLQSKFIAVLEHPYPKLRLRYWKHTAHNQTIWFLDEIGKERPISFGVSVINNRIEIIKVLAFRESRGGEISMISFSEQFHQIGLDKDNKLDQHIDGISGATMSVIAMKKIAKLGLILHKEVML